MIVTGQAKLDLPSIHQTIQCVSYSPDGRLLLAGTEEGGLFVWEFASGLWKTMAKQAAESVGRVAWLDGAKKAIWARYVEYYGDGDSPINRHKPSGGAGDIESGKTMWTFMSYVRQDFQTLAASPDGKRLAILEIPDQPRAAYILDASSGKVLARLLDSRHACGPLSVCIGPNASKVAAGYAPFDIILWNADKEEALHLLKGHENWVVSLAFLQDGQLLISGAGDGTARIWSTASGQEIGRIRFSHDSQYIESVGFFPATKRAYALTAGRLVIVATPSIPTAVPSTPST